MTTNRPADRNHCVATLWLPAKLFSSTTLPAKLLLLSCLLAAAGCSGNLKTYPVDGKVQFVGGGVVHVGTVELKSREHGVQARGSIEKGGKFRLTTYTDGDGAVAGTHDCVIVQMVIAEDVSGHRPSTIGVIDPKYNSYATSGLVVEIKPDGVNEVVLEVEGIRESQPESHTH